MATPPAAPGRRVSRVARWITLHVLRGIWVSTMILTPLFGFWLASSLAAYQNASPWLALLGGLALFPLVPVGWELVATWRRSKQEAPKRQILTRLDRLVLRTLVLNGVFLALMLWQARATAFRAIAVRGDWMLDGHDGPIATKLRGALLALADRLDARAERPASEDYGTSDEAPDPTTIKPRDPEPVLIAPVPAKRDPNAWPLEAAPDPRVVNMPEVAQATIGSVGAYLREQFADRRQRVKAMHDFIALRLEYDHEGLAASKSGRAPRPPQDAESVFATRKAVCEGYARLMVALGKEAHVEVKYVTGSARETERRLSTTAETGDEESIKAVLHGYGHAWNAVLIDDEWLLVDVTWDDGGAARPIDSTYLFTPPELFAYDHLPDDPAWQLVMRPISVGDFARQPFLSPRIGAVGVTLESPKRSQVSVSGEVQIELANPYHATVSAYARRDGSPEGATPIRCTDATADRRTTVTCELPAGEFEVVLFGAPPSQPRGGTLGHIGSILVNSR